MPRAPKPPKHSHLDRMVRERGTCPACDVFWAAQDARLNNVRSNSAERQIASLTEREVARWTMTFCTAIVDVAPLDRRPNECESHTCILPDRHTGLHRCPMCDQTWKSR